MNPNEKMHPGDIRNLIVFMAVSILLWLSYDHFIIKPHSEALQAQQSAMIQAAQTPQALQEKERPRAEVISASKRIPIKNQELTGTLNLTGGRIDDLSLTQYFRKVDKKETVTLLSPSGGPFPRYAEFGWVPVTDSKISLPDADTVWQAVSGTALTPTTPVTLRWSNGQGLTFEKIFSLDENYGFTVVQRIKNQGSAAVTLSPYALVTEHGLPEEFQGNAIVHEGPLGYVDGELVEHGYGGLAETGRDVRESTSGWAGITHKYWLTALVPDQKENMTYRFAFTPKKTVHGKDKYQADILGTARTITPGETAEFSLKMFSGVKKVEQLENYEKLWGVTHLDLAVDFGLLYFLTRPFFFVLNTFYGWVGNFGIAILMFTVVLRICVFPLANTSFRSFAKLKQISPAMYELREKYKDDRPKLQQELVALYQREKVNPMAGCLPILIQIPIFFALFKVLSVTIEMRHAPFFGWIQDLSAPDPTTIFNLFGLINWNPPSALMIGIWPCLMLISMLIQKSLNPTPDDKVQAVMLAIMPWFMTYILAKFACGLVIYWTFNNILSTVQQYIIMRSMGVEVKFFGKNKAKSSDLLSSIVPDETPSKTPDTPSSSEENGEPKNISAPKPKKKKKK